MSETEAAKTVHAMLQAMTAALQRRETIIIKGFGTLRPFQKRYGPTLLFPRTIPGTAACVSFRIAQELKYMMNKDYTDNA